MKPEEKIIFGRERERVNKRLLLVCVCVFVIEREIKRGVKYDGNME